MSEGTVVFNAQSDIDALRRDLADTQKRLAKAEASIERMLAQWPRRFTPSELVNQTYHRIPRPPHYSEGTDPLGR